MKKCTYCKTEKETTNFSKNQALSDGLDNICKTCRKEFNKRQNTSYQQKLRLPVSKGVYYFKDGNEIIYIGQSENLGRRINNHITSDSVTALKGYSKAERLRLKWYIAWYGDDDQMRLDQERALIQLHKPKLNKQHNA